MAHGQWSEVEARGIVEAWRRSGLPLERFSKQRGLVPQRIRWWMKKLDSKPDPSATTILSKMTPAVLPVRVAAETSRRGEPVTVLLRTGHMLKVSHGFDEEAFSRV